MNDRLQRAIRSAAEFGPVQQLAIRYKVRFKPRRTTVHGITIDVDRTWFSGVLLGLYRGNYEAPEADLLRRTLRPSDIYLEVGAAIGVMMTIACTIVGDWKVTAVEADPSLASAARHTAEINGFHPTVINAVLGHDEAEHSFYVRDDFWESSLIPHEGAREIKVAGRRLSTELERTEATYLMVDIEGAEIDLLRDPLPEHVRALCVELHPGRVGAPAIQDLLRHIMDQGFVIHTEMLAPQVVFLSRGA